MIPKFSCPYSVPEEAFTIKMWNKGLVVRPETDIEELNDCPLGMVNVPPAK
jgi:hypothetical protein